MTAPNPYGVNQLGDDRVPYGQAKAMKTLAGEAPMSGAPIATQAINAPDRARQPARGALSPSGGNPAPPVGAEPVDPAAQYAVLWQSLAATPGASDQVKQYAALANGSPS